MGGEKRTHRLDGIGDAGHQRMTVLRVIDRRRKHIFQLGGAVIAQQRQPCAESTGDAGGKKPCSRNNVEALILEILHRRLCREGP